MRQYQPVVRNRNERSLENRWNPLNEFRTEFDQLFNDFWGETARAVPGASRREMDFVPACDISEDEGHFLITLEVAGIPQDQMKLEVRDHRLFVSGERKTEMKKEGMEGRFYTERNYGRFERSFALPENVDVDRLEAQYENGILRILVPKMEVAKPREIKIQTGSEQGLLGKLFGKSTSSAPIDASSNERH